MVQDIEHKEHKQSISFYQYFKYKTLFPYISIIDDKSEHRKNNFHKNQWYVIESNRFDKVQWHFCITLKKSQPTTRR